MYGGREAEWGAGRQAGKVVAGNQLGHEVMRCAGLRLTGMAQDKTQLRPPSHLTRQAAWEHVPQQASQHRLIGTAVGQRSVRATMRCPGEQAVQVTQGVAGARDAQVLREPQGVQEARMAQQRQLSLLRLPLQQLEVIICGRGWGRQRGAHAGCPTAHKAVGWFHWQGGHKQAVLKASNSLLRYHSSLRSRLNKAL